MWRGGEVEPTSLLMSQANKMDNILTAIAGHSTIDPQRLGASDKPRDWDDAQWCSLSEVAEWKAAFEDKAKSLKDIGIYVLILYSEVPEGTKIC